MPVFPHLFNHSNACLPNVYDHPFGNVYTDDSWGFLPTIADAEKFTLALLANTIGPDVAVAHAMQMAIEEMKAEGWTP